MKPRVFRIHTGPAQVESVARKLRVALNDFVYVFDGVEAVVIRNDAGRTERAMQLIVDQTFGHAAGYRVISIV